MMCNLPDCSILRDNAAWQIQIPARGEKILKGICTLQRYAVAYRGPVQISFIIL